MTTEYIANDGTKFDDELECADYEWGQKHPYLKDIKLYDKDNNRMEDVFSEWAYARTKRIVVENEEAAKSLRELGNYTGFCCYESVSSSGSWIYDKKNERFIKEEG